MPLLFLRTKGEECMSRSRHTEAQMIGALKHSCGGHSGNRGGEDPYHRRPMRLDNEPCVRLTY
jgi:hypothetical protein